jgi:hypothetical protein
MIDMFSMEDLQTVFNTGICIGMAFQLFLFALQTWIHGRLY